ncbi:hypothetical protein C9374_009084 [Naegleria lovaniensis]|uniref:Ras-GEF domain-containing protein n=1 Tax=Naegleria lovaniensis TaxID=51637 RepID=A0AA88GFH2_NAELO|nr:uncharacterized protein C9374_009084 [Naegleria lovaniensis]KAG2377568.1 hypothetical protein C9374_009084 [Naegleria lovaniensis]
MQQKDEKEKRFKPLNHFFSPTRVNTFSSNTLDRSEDMKNTRTEQEQPLLNLRNSGMIKKKILLRLFEKYLREHDLEKSASVLDQEMKKLDLAAKSNHNHEKTSILNCKLRKYCSNINHEVLTRWINELDGSTSIDEMARIEFPYYLTPETVLSNNSDEEEEILQALSEWDVESLLSECLSTMNLKELNGYSSILSSNLLETDMAMPTRFETVMKYVDHSISSKSEKPLDKLCLMYQSLGISSLEFLTCIQYLIEKTPSCEQQSPNSDPFVNIHTTAVLLLKVWLSKYYLKYSQFETGGYQIHKKIIGETLRFLQTSSCKEKESIVGWIMNGSVSESHSTTLRTLENMLMEPIVTARQKKHSKPLVTIFDIGVELMSLHLSYLFGKFFLTIEPQELIGANWTKSRRKYLSPNILDNIDIFNRYSTWFASLVIQEQEKSKRVQVLEYLIKLASCCYRVGNFYAVYVIASALSSGPVGRLKQTFNALSTECEIEYERIRTATSTDMNSANYTKALKEVFTKASENPSQYCCIPNLGKHLGELTLTEESVQDVDYKVDVIYELISSKVLDLQRVLLQSMMFLQLDYDVLLFVLEARGTFSNSDEMMILSKQYEINTPMRSKTLSNLSITPSRLK